MRAAVREAVGGQIAISNVAPSHVPVNADGRLANLDTQGPFRWLVGITDVRMRRYAWTLSVAGGYNRCVQLLVSMGLTMRFFDRRCAVV